MTCRPIFLQRPFHVMLPMSLRLPSISSNIQIIASLLLSLITRSLTLIDSSSDFCSSVLGLVACCFSFWLYLSLCFPPPFNLQTISTIVSSPSLVTSVQLTVLPPSTKYTWNTEPTSFSSLALLPLDPPQASPPSAFELFSNLKPRLPRRQLLLLLHSVPVSVPLRSVCCARILGTGFLICSSPPTHMTTSPVRLQIQLSLPIDSHSLSPKHSVQLSQRVRFRTRVCLSHNSGSTVSQHPV